MTTVIHCTQPAPTIVVQRAEPTTVTHVVPAPVRIDGNDTNVEHIDHLSRTVEVITAGPQGRRGEAGPIGPAGGNVLALPAATTLGGHRVVRSTGNGMCGYASAADLTHGDDVLGVTLGAVTVGANANVQVAGEVIEPSWSWTPQEPVFLGLDGVLTQDPLSDDVVAFLLVIGFATAPDALMLRIEAPIYFED